MATHPRAVVFDLGGVLIDWNPRYLYRTLFGDDTAAMEHFLTHVCSPAWNHRQDAGRSFAEGRWPWVRKSRTSSSLSSPANAQPSSQASLPACRT